jgi:hypothetical protein
VIEPVVPRDLPRQPHQAVGGFGFARSSAMLAEQFLEQVDEAGPRALGGELVVANAVDPDLVRVGVGEAVPTWP